MKVTWKNKKKKRCLPTLSHFTDLPFEHNHQQHSNTDAEDGAHVPDATQLANEFQAQGDKLAMVSCFILTHTHVVCFRFCCLFIFGEGKGGLRKH